MKVAYTQILLVRLGSLSPYRVRGEALGPHFVLHKWPKKLGRRLKPLWRITHRQTGHYLINAETRAEALRRWRLVKALTVRHRLDWSFTDPDIARAWRAGVRRQIGKAIYG